MLYTVKCKHGSIFRHLCGVGHIAESTNELTYMYIRIHRVKYKADANTRTNTHTFHPTCSVNREQDVADIWVHEQTRDAPRKREGERESREGGTDERERESGRETERMKTERERETGKES